MTTRVLLPPLTEDEADALSHLQHAMPGVLFADEAAWIENGRVVNKWGHVRDQQEPIYDHHLGVIR